MKKHVLLSTILIALGMLVSAQTVIFEDDFESYDDDYNLTGAGYVVWEGTAKVSDITIDGGTANEGNKYGLSDAGKVNFAFRKSFTLEAGKTYTWTIATKAQDGLKHKLQIVPTTEYAVTEATNADWHTHNDFYGKSRLRRCCFGGLSLWQKSC